MISDDVIVARSVALFVAGIMRTVVLDRRNCHPLAEFGPLRRPIPSGQ